MAEILHSVWNLLWIITTFLNYYKFQFQWFQINQWIPDEYRSSLLNRITVKLVAWLLWWCFNARGGRLLLIEQKESGTYLNKWNFPLHFLFIVLELSRVLFKTEVRAFDYETQLSNNGKPTVDNSALTFIREYCQTHWSAFYLPSSRRIY